MILIQGLVMCVFVCVCVCGGGWGVGGGGAAITPRGLEDGEFT